MVEKQKILIVDDDNNIAELISLYFTKECFNTLIVNDGESALTAFDEFHPDLILLDLMLPGIDGYQVCREIRTKSVVPLLFCFVHLLFPFVYQRFLKWGIRGLPLKSSGAEPL